MESRGISPRQTATFLYLALLMSPLLFTAVAIFLRTRSGTAIPVGREGDAVRWAAYGFALVGYASALALRSRIAPRAPAEPEDAWWLRHQTRLIMLWALVEGPMLLGAVLYLLQGDLAALVAITGIGLLLMMLHTPGRLAGSA